MKILFDPVYTNRPSVCSTSYLVWELIARLMEWRDDVFFYVLYPPHKMQEEDWKFMGKYPDRVTLLPLEQSTSDRVSELHMLRNAQRFYLNPWCKHTWDADVVISSRMPVIKHMRVHASRYTGKELPSQRAFIGLEEMPILPFRHTVPWSEFQFPDTLMSYALNDLTLVNHQWLTASLKPVLREVLSPAYQKRVLDRIAEVVPVKLKRLILKSQMYSGGPFNLTFVGRITGTRNFGDVAELFRKQFSYPLGKNKQDVQFLVSTNSESMGASMYGEVDFIDFQMNNREQFYSFLTQAHVAVNLSTVEDFSLSTYETLMMGVPMIIRDHPWNAFLGSEYPFRCSSDLEVYAMINKFASDYEEMYKKFAHWEATYWADYVAGPKNLTTAEALISWLEGFLKRRTAQLQGKGGSFVEQLHSIAPVDGVLDLTKHIEEHGTSVMTDKVPDHFSLPVGRVPNNLVLKLVAEREGWIDTNQTGVMVKS